MAALTRRPAPVVSTTPAAVATDGGHLYAVDLYRVVTFTFVVAQHAVLFTAPVTSASGEGVVFLLHFTREAFFMLTAFVLVHSYLRRPLATAVFWRRRIPLVVVPFLAWTLIYISILSVQRHSSFVGAVGMLVHYAASGYYHLYFLVVTVQVYLLFPLLVRLLRRTRGHHGEVFGCSAALQLMIVFALHASDRPHATGLLHAVVSVVLPSKSVFTYQLFVLAGALAAWHRAALDRIISLYSRQLAVGVGAVAALSLGWYALSVARGNPPSYAADVFQPVTVIWSLAAAVGMYLLGMRWAQCRDRGIPRRFDKAICWASDASFGIYLVHVLMLRITVACLSDLQIDESWPWPAKALLVLTISLPASGGFVAIARHTSMSRALTGRARTAATSAA
jgi:peptidoglycan/LPS O-acetylase OafA/YrhL